MSQQTTRIINYTVRQGDQLERIALNYMGAADRWIELAILNGLDYPYITDDLTFVRNVKATGTVTFARTLGSTGAVTIPAGSIVSAPATANAPARFYTTDAQCVIADGVTTVDQTVTATVAGEGGNCPALQVNTLNFSVTNLASVKNGAAITGGVILNVKFPGDPLLVYTDATASTDTVGVNTQSLQGNSQDSFYASLLGVDVGLDKNGDLQADSRGGLALSAGLFNLRDALKHRLQIPLAWYPFYSFYGTNIEQAIGQRGENYWLQWAAIEAERTVRTDPRVADVANMRAAFKSGVLTLTFDVTAIGQTSAQNLVVSLQTAGGIL